MVSVRCRNPVGEGVGETSFALSLNFFVLNEPAARSVNALLGASVTEKHLRKLSFSFMWNSRDKRFNTIGDGCHYNARQNFMTRISKRGWEGLGERCIPENACQDNGEFFTMSRS